MRAFLSVDIEGATGVASWSQCEGPTASAYDFGFARRMLTHDVNAAIRGARAAGATEIVVKDSHSTGKNLLVEDLERGVELISGYGAGKDGMMEGIDSSFGASMLVGYHAMAGTAAGVMEHALAGGLHRFWINGQEAGEIAASAGVAGAYGVPLVMVSSDEAGCAEARELIPGLETYAVKEGLGKFLGRMRHPSVTGPGIEEAARRAVAAASEIRPYVVEGPVTLRIEFHTSEQVDLAATFEGVRRVDGYTLELERPTFLEAHCAAYIVFHLAARGRVSGE